MTTAHRPLYSYIRALRGTGAAGITAETIAAFGLPDCWVNRSMEQTRQTSERVNRLLWDVISTLPLQDQIIARTYFGPGDADARADAAFKALKESGTASESTYRSGIEGVANDVARVLTSRLGPDTGQPSDDLGRRAAPWYEILETEWRLKIDPDDHRRQHWSFTDVVRCRFAVQPFLAIPLQWSGEGHTEGDPWVDEGPREAPYDHRWLRTRPEWDAAGSYDIYVFDLGHPLLPEHRRAAHVGHDALRR